MSTVEAEIAGRIKPSADALTLTFEGDPGPVACSVRNRFRSLQQVIPFQLDLLGVVEVPAADLKKIEREYHQRFKAHRQVGEWFRLEGELDTFCLSLARGELAA